MDTTPLQPRRAQSVLAARSLSIIPKMIRARFDWKREDTEDPSMVLLINYKTGERLLANREQLFGFFYEDWEAQYLPTNIEGKRVLDVGAGWGETVYFFRKHGYNVTAAIESNETNLGCLEANSINHRWAVEIVDRPFRVEDLKELAPLYDYVKMDIEGSERKLLELDKLPPIVLETHSPYVTAQLLAKFQDLRIRSHRKDTAILTNVG